jgi:hypothetical protein
MHKFLYQKEIVNTMNIKLNIKKLRKFKKTTIMSTEESLKDIERWFEDPFAPYREPSDDKYVNGDYEDSNK